MASLVVTVDVVGARAIMDKFSSWSSRASDVTPAYVAISEMMMAYEREMYYTEGAISGEKWAELSQETERTKMQKSEYGQQIGVASGETMDSLTEQNATGQILEITPEYLRFGSEVEQANYMQHGTSRHNMPARPPLKFRQADLEAFARIVFLYVTKGIVSPEPFQL